MSNKEQLHKNIIVLIKSGKTKRQISKTLNVSEKVISFIAKQNNLTLAKEISRGNAELYDMIKKLFPYLYVEKEKHIKYGLKIDLYIDSIRLGFEVDGVQHDKYVPFFHKTEDDFHAQVGRDSLKESLSRKEEIELIRYKELPTEEELYATIINRIHTYAENS